ncbi:sensor histidine kinase [Roseovarius sp. S1116L3]|uniref:sensor histidine kinase n=1 Tax=Roseovarius roseus TaxID=3342636 RepID=UPI0037285AEE
MRPSPLAAAFTCLVILVMLGLGLFIISKYRSLQLQSHGKVGSVYIDNLLAPYALSLQNGTPPRAPGMEHVFRNLTEDNSLLLLRIWRLDGTLVFSTFPTDGAEQHNGDDLDISLDGHFIAKLETEGAADPTFPMSYPYFEVYAPIHDPETGEMVAVGEIYQDATEILHDRAFVERTIWGALAFATLGVLAMLALSFSQSAQLQDRLKTERKMTAQNCKLRQEADQARLDAAEANEQVLNLIGAELHDGPVQLLGLMSLMDNTDATADLADGTTLRSLTDQVMTELRAMSAGLILPELDGLDAAGVVALAVERHQALTGEAVELDMDIQDIALDPPRNVCLFRIVQEGLTNAVRHSGGKTPQVGVKSRGAHLDISIRSGSSINPETVPKKPAWKLGLHGMRRRLEPFRGKLELENGADETTLRVMLPTRLS